MGDDDVCFVLTANGEWAPFTTSTSTIDDDVKVEEASLTRDIARKLWNASTWLDMVNDARRNEAFANGLAVTVRRGDVALDVGTGTGILSVMASRVVGASPGRVDALEEFGPSAVVARRVVEDNGVADRVRVIQRRSDNHGVTGGKYDVVFSELLDSSLIGEGWLGVVRDAKRRLLREGGRVLPRRARVYARLVECAEAFEYYSPTSRPSAAPPNVDALAVIWCDESQQAHAKAWRRTMRAISDDVVIAEMDFENLPDEGAEPVWRKPLDAIRGASGRAHAVLTWWEIDLDEDGIATYSTKPEEQSAWCHHWRQCLKLIPANVRLTVDTNSTLEFVSTFDGDTIYVGISGDGIANEADDYVRSASLAIEAPIEAPWARHLGDDSSSRARLVCFGANLPEFVASKSSLGVVHGVDLSKANDLLCPKETELHPNAPSGAKSLEFLPSFIHVFELGLSLESAAATPPTELMRFVTNQTEGCVTITATNDNETFDTIIIHLVDAPVSANENADPFAPPTNRSLADAARQAVLIIPEPARHPRLNLWYTVADPSSSSSSVRDLRFALIP